MNLRSKRPRLLLTLLALLLSSAPALAADGVTAKKITLPPKKNTLRHFRHWGNKVGEFKGTLTPAQIASNAKNRPVDVPQPKPAPAKLLVHLHAANLPEGKLTKWTGTGSEKSTFVPGLRGDTLAPMATSFLNVTGLRVEANRELISSFDVPACLKRGPFTIRYKIASPLAAGAAPILNWGSAKLLFGSNPRGNALLEWKSKGKKQVELYDPTLPKGSRNLNIAMSYVWRDIALVYDGKAFQYYVDGKLEREKTMPYVIGKKLGKLTIGAMSRYGEVCLNEIEIFSKALRQKDIQAIAKGKSVAASSKEVSVSFAKFTPGQKILAATNRGTLQGEFRVKPDVDHTPDVKTVDGVKCVWFDGKADFLQSAKAVPGLVTGTNPFTVEMKVYSEDDTGKGAILALAPEVAFLDSPGLTLNRSLYFAFSKQTAMVNRRDGGSPMRWAKGAPAKMKTWTTLKYVYEGGYRSNIKLYINGQLNNTISWKTLSTISGHPMRIGATLNTHSGEKSPFKGGVAEIKIYCGVKKD